MSLEDKAKRVHQSYNRAGGRALVATFYDHLMKSDEEIRKKFEQVNMEVQTDNMARAVVMSFLFASNNHHTAGKVIDKVRESHSKNNLNISPQLYDKWLDCLLQTVAVCDPEANEELLSDWHAVMSVAVNHIREGY